MKELTDRLRTASNLTQPELNRSEPAPQPVKEIKPEPVNVAPVKPAVETSAHEFEARAQIFSRPSEQDPAVSIAPFKPEAVSEAGN